MLGQYNISVHLLITDPPASPCGICDGDTGTETAFSAHFHFSMTIIAPTYHIHLAIDSDTSLFV
jgi:hypothetical protein